MTGARVLVAGALLTGLLLSPAQGFVGGLRGYVPPADRIARAAASANRAAKRAAPLELQVEVRMARGEEVAARGTLLSDPRGRARLELQHESGFQERHLAVPGRYRASRDGSPLERPRILLPPLYLLQLARGADLSRWLSERGAPVRAELGYDGDHDCYVLGERDGRAALWIDQDTLSIVRVDLPGGHRVRMGPPQVFEGIQLPEWVEISTSGGPPLRLELTGGASAKADPAAFDPSWLGRLGQP